MKGKRKRSWGWLIPVLASVLILVLFRLVLLIGYVPTESMEPTIEKGSYIVGIRIFPELKVGDIIIFERDGELLVKRIAAVGGEVVERNGVGIAVPEGCFYVLGDNAENSYDSRYWEDPFVSAGDVKGNLLCILSASR